MTSFIFNLILLVVLAFFCGYMCNKFIMIRRIHRSIFKTTDAYQDRIDVLIQSEHTDEEIKEFNKIQTILEGRLEVTSEIVDCLKKL